MILCEDIFKKRQFDSYSEFYLAMCIAAECKRRGTRLNISNMTVRYDILSKNELEYFDYLKSVEAVYIEGFEYKDNKHFYTEDMKYYLDLSVLESLKDHLFSIKNERYYWSPDVVSESYTDAPVQYRKISNLGNVLMHLVAYYIVGRYYGELEDMKLLAEFDVNMSKNTYLYVNVYSCILTLPWFKEMVELSIDIDNAKIDLEYSIFCNNGIVAGHRKLLSVKEKLKLMQEKGMVEGSILVLYTRSGLNQSNSIGKISNAVIARVDEIGDTFLGVTTMALNKTKEEVRLDYESIEPEKRYIFADLLNFNVKQFISTLSLYELGIDDYMYSESKFITLLSKSEKVCKRITIDGKEGDVSMSSIDAIYWLLCQYSIEFDRELYRNMYNDGKDLMWDLYGDDTDLM